jgi:hypothetical protein
MFNALLQTDNKDSSDTEKLSTVLADVVKT